MFLSGSVNGFVHFHLLEVELVRAQIFRALALGFRLGSGLGLTKIGVSPSGLGNLQLMQIIYSILFFKYATRIVCKKPSGFGAIWAWAFYLCSAGPFQF